MKLIIFLAAIVLFAGIATAAFAQVDTTAKIQQAQRDLIGANSMYYPAKASITNYGGGNDSIRIVIGYLGTFYWVPISNAGRIYFNQNVVNYWKAQRREAIDTLNKYKGADK